MKGQSIIKKHNQSVLKTESNMFTEHIRFSKSILNCAEVTKMGENIIMAIRLIYSMIAMYYKQILNAK